MFFSRQIWVFKCLVMLLMFVISLILFRMGWGVKRLPYQFFYCNFYKRRNSPKNFLTFSFNPFSKPFFGFSLAGITVSTFIITTYMWQILGRWTLLPPLSPSLWWLEFSPLEVKYDIFGYGDEGTWYKHPDKYSQLKMINDLIVVPYLFFVYFNFFSLSWFFFHNHSRITGL